MSYSSIQTGGTSSTAIATYLFGDDGTFPNNSRLKLVVYSGCFGSKSPLSPEKIEQLFTGNNWPSQWRNGLYTVHHYHSKAHEALGIYAGWVRAQLGGPTGEVVVVKAGDVVIIPAGVSHKNLEQSDDFRVLGAYPIRQDWDMNYGHPGERPEADKRIAGVALPTTDPVYGARGPLHNLWSL